jgi:hypothetical protein
MELRVRDARLGNNFGESTLKLTCTSMEEVPPACAEVELTSVSTAGDGLHFDPPGINERSNHPADRGFRQLEPTRQIPLSGHVEFVHRVKEQVAAVADPFSVLQDAIGGVIHAGREVMQRSAEIGAHPTNIAE